MIDDLVMAGVREYSEELEVLLGEKNGRTVLRALYDFGYAETSVDLLDVFAWVKSNRPDLLAEAGLHPCE